MGRMGAARRRKRRRLPIPPEATPPPSCRVSQRSACGKRSASAFADTLPPPHRSEERSTRWHCTGPRRGLPSTSWRARSRNAQRASTRPASWSSACARSRWTTPSFWRRRASSSSGAPSGLPQDTPRADGDGGAAPEGAKTVHGIPSISELFEGLVSQEEAGVERDDEPFDECLGRALEIGYGLATSNAPQVQLVINGCRDVIVRPGEVT